MDVEREQKKKKKNEEEKKKIGRAADDVIQSADPLWIPNPLLGPPST